MKHFFSVLFMLSLATAFAQKEGNVSDINTGSVASRVDDQIRNLNNYQNQGIQTFKAPDSTFTPIYFEAFPQTASTYVAIDFPPERNIQFIRIINIAGEVVASYRPYQRTFYIGKLMSGTYQVQVVQRDFNVHTAVFCKR